MELLFGYSTCVRVKIGVIYNQKKTKIELDVTYRKKIRRKQIICNESRIS